MEREREPGVENIPDTDEIRTSPGKSRNCTGDVVSACSQG